MSKLFVLSNIFHRFRDDFFPCGTHIIRNPCSSCETNVNGWSPPLRYWWDYEFGDPKSSLNANHHCFWGGFRLMVDCEGRALLQNTDIPFNFHPTTMTEGKLLFDQQSSLTCVTIDSIVEADPVECKNTSCASCGHFIERRRQITRLRISKSIIPDSGVFMIRQNGEFGPMFVTETAREILTQTGLVGIGYYPAGCVI